VLPEACGQLLYAADGNISPVICPDSRPNVAADKYLRQLHLRVLALGPDASPGDVQQAMCADFKAPPPDATTGPIEQSAYELARVEQNWRFGVDLSTTSGC
jgi:hypothetical protein